MVGGWLGTKEGEEALSDMLETELKFSFIEGVGLELGDSHAWEVFW